MHRTVHAAEAEAPLCGLASIAMNLSMKYLFSVALCVALFEALSAVWLNAPDVTGQVLAGIFAVAFGVCAWLMARRQSLVAASVIGVLLLVDVGGVPFYGRSSVADLLVQLVFALVGLIGLAAWAQLLLDRRRTRRSPVL